MTYQSTHTGEVIDAAITKVGTVDENANNYSHPNHSGDVTSDGDGATTIANDVVTNAKLANVGSGTIKGRTSASTGDPEDLSASDVRGLINVADGATANPNAASLSYSNTTSEMAATNVQEGIDELASMIDGLSDVASSGSYNDLDDRPTLGSAAAADTGDFAAAVHSHDAATDSTAGFMPASAVTKLQGIANNADVTAFANVSATSGDWRGEGSETLIEAVADLHGALGDIENALDAILGEND
ncbi:MAG: hypothetical protein WCY93_07300 [Anaerolineaceae bacterium]